MLEIQGWLHALSTEVVSLINFDDDILEKVNGLFAVAVVNFDLHTHAVDVALNDFAVRLVTCACGCSSAEGLKVKSTSMFLK